MNTYIGTFPVGDKANSKHFVRIACYTQQEAEKYMFDTYQMNWCKMYHDPYEDVEIELVNNGCNLLAEITIQDGRTEVNMIKQSAATMSEEQIKEEMRHHLAALVELQQQLKEAKEREANPSFWRIIVSTDGSIDQQKLTNKTAGIVFDEFCVSDVRMQYKGTIIDCTATIYIKSLELRDEAIQRCKTKLIKFMKEQKSLIERSMNAHREKSQSVINEIALHIDKLLNDFHENQKVELLRTIDLLHKKGSVWYITKIEDDNFYISTGECISKQYLSPTYLKAAKDKHIDVGTFFIGQDVRLLKDFDIDFLKDETATIHYIKVGANEEESSFILSNAHGKTLFAYNLLSLNNLKPVWLKSKTYQ